MINREDAQALKIEEQRGLIQLLLKQRDDLKAKLDEAEKAWKKYQHDWEDMFDWKNRLESELERLKNVNKNLIQDVERHFNELERLNKELK